MIRDPEVAERNLQYYLYDGVIFAKQTKNSDGAWRPSRLTACIKHCKPKVDFCKDHGTGRVGTRRCL